MAQPNPTSINPNTDSLVIVEPFEASPSGQYPELVTFGDQDTVEERLSAMLFELNRAAAMLRAFKFGNMATLIGGLTDDINGFRVLRQAEEPSLETAKFGDIWLQPGEAGEITTRVYNGTGFVEELYAVDAILIPIKARLDALESDQAEVVQEALDGLQATILGTASGSADTLGKLEGLVSTLATTVAGKRDAGPVAAVDITGVLDPARIPPSVRAMPQVSSGGIAALTSEQQALIGEGSPVLLSDGRVLYYKGTGSKTSEASYVIGADQSPAVDQIPSLPISKTTGLQAALDAKQAAFFDVLPVKARTSLPTTRDDGGALQLGDQIFRSDLDQPMRYYGDGFRVTGFMDTKELTNFVPESSRSAVFGGSVDAMPYIIAAHAQLGDGGRLILPSGTFDLRSQGQITANGFKILGGGRSSVLRQNSASGPVFVFGRTDAGSVVSYDITLEEVLLTRAAGNHAFFETTKLRSMILQDVEWSGIYALAVLGRAGLGAGTYQLWMEDCDGAMDAAGHGVGIQGINCSGGIYTQRVFTEGRHDVSNVAWIDISGNSANQVRMDGISIHGGNVKGFRNALRSIDSRLVNGEFYGARFDEMGQAAVCVESSATPTDLARVGFEGLAFTGCVNGAGNLPNKGFLRIRNDANSASFVGVSFVGCHSNRVTGPVIDIETHVSNGAAVSQVMIAGLVCKDVSMPDDVTSLIRLKNNVRNIEIEGVSSRVEGSTRPLHLVDLDLVAGVPASNIFVSGVVGDVAAGGLQIRDPLGKNQALPTKAQFLAANNPWTGIQTFPESTIDGMTGRLMRTIKDAGTINDDSVRSYVIGTGRAGRVFVSANANQYVEALFESIGTPSITSLREHANASTSSIVLTGTTGVDGELTVSFNTDTLYIENRLGATVRLNIVIEYNEST